MIYESTIFCTYC